MLLTGDRWAPAREVAAVLGLDQVRAEQTPASKVAAVRDEQERAVTVMVGDGLNDAPALAAASVGVAMGTRGATAASEAADVVLTTDRLHHLAEPVRPGTRDLLRRFAAEHGELHEVLPQLRSAADELAAGPTAQALEALRRARAALVEQLVPHEQAEEAELYPALAELLGDGEALAPMSRAHAEIGRLARRLEALVPADNGGTLSPERQQELLACLYGLHALLQLHYTQEEENYFALVAD